MTGRVEQLYLYTIVQNDNIMLVHGGFRCASQGVAGRRRLFLPSDQID